MTALRQNALNMVELVPEEKLFVLVSYLSDIIKKNVASNETTIEDESYLALLKMIKPIPNLDEKRELNEYLSERYAIPNSDIPVISSEEFCKLLYDGENRPH